MTHAATLRMGCIALVALACAQSVSLERLQLEIIGDVSNARDTAALQSKLEGVLGRLRSGAVSSATVGADGSVTHTGAAAAVTAVIGGGLSGLTTTLHLLLSGHSVVLVDKASFFGGNSAKASSGINGCLTDQQKQGNIDDSPQRFFDDTLKSSQRDQDSYTGRLARKMADMSAEAVAWLAKHSGVELPDVGRMGGHTADRTHRPRGRLSGAAFVSGLERAIGKYKGPATLTVHKATKLEQLTPIESKGSNAGWHLRLRRVAGKNKGEEFSLDVQSVVLATGGFSADKGANGLLAEVAPDVRNLATTNGAFATGDGIRLARAVGAATVDLDMVQVHPTGFTATPKGFKQTDEERPLILAAEILRGSGGVLLDKAGRRFVNELDTRKAVTAKMNGTGQKGFVLALPPAAAKKVPAHVRIYGDKGLLNKVDGAKGVAAFIRDELKSDCSERNVKDAFEELNSGKGPQRPEGAETKLPATGEYHVGVVQPVLHYTMGGLRIDSESTTVLDVNGTAIDGLFATGELIGGVHGVNRLGGSSLLDCVVFGIVAARAAAARAATRASSSDVSTAPAVSAPTPAPAAPSATTQASSGGDHADLSKIPAAERKRVKIGKEHFDISQFLDLHPGGAIEVGNGDDLTERFVAAHGKDWDLLERHEIVPVTAEGEPKAQSDHSQGKEEHHLAQYGGKGGSWREIVGRHTWFLLHSIAAKFPEYPNQADRDAMHGIIGALGQLYPCKLCRKHLKQQLRNMQEMGSPALNSRTDLIKWMCKMHNIVNKDIGKPLFDCTPINLDMMYLKNCGECEVEKKGEKKVPEHMMSGYHPHSGPWDHHIYMRDPPLLSSVTKKGQLWSVKQALDNAELLATLKVAQNSSHATRQMLGTKENKARAKKVKAAIAKGKAAIIAALGTDLKALQN